MSLSRFQYIIVSYVLLLPVIVNLFTWEQPVISLLFGGVFVIFQSIFIGEQLVKSTSLIERIIHGFFLFLILLLIVSSITYLLISLSPSLQALVYLSLPLLISQLDTLAIGNLQKRLEIQDFSFQLIHLPKQQLFFTILYIGLFFSLVWILLSSSTTQAISSPWTQIPSIFWLIYFLTTVCLFFLTWFSTNKIWSTTLTSLHLLLTFSIGLFIYKLGYGFDPFIHQATERLILADGVVTPKTPYYIGQYSLLVSLHRLIGVSLLSLDRLLVPLTAAISLPLLFIPFLPRKNSFAKSSFAWVALTLLFIPFSSFVVTTPQGFANILFLWLIIGSFPLLSHQEPIYPLPILWFIAIAAVLTHPLTGIPGIIFLLLLTLDLTKDQLSFPAWLQKSFYIETIVVGSISVPLLFLLNTLLSPNFSTHVVIPSLAELSSSLSWWPLAFSPEPPLFRSTFFEFAYFIQANAYWIFTLIILIVVYWFYSRRKQSLIRPYLTTAFILVLNAFFLSGFLQFPELISYEAQDYARRLFDLALWTLLPLVALGTIWITEKAKNKSLLMIFFFIFGASWLITGNLFASYPRENRYEKSRQYNTSLADYRAVNKINEIAKDSFVVLSNQQVSAAAIAEFGFKHYHSGPNNEPIFYYPVPTSGPLYQLYLEMIQQPSKETAREAKNLVGVNDVFFVVNNYWDNAETIIERAKSDSDNWIEINEGESIIFVYRFKNES